jgi:hypothetical protein
MCVVAIATRNARLLLLLTSDELLLTDPTCVEGLPKLLLVVAGPTCTVVTLPNADMLLTTFPTCCCSR